MVVFKIKLFIAVHERFEIKIIFTKLILRVFSNLYELVTHITNVLHYCIIKYVTKEQVV